MDNKLRSIAKMQWVWLALQDSRYKTRFWRWFSEVDNKLNPWWDMDVRTCVDDLFPLLRMCSFCRIAVICGECILDDTGECDVAGRELLWWLEGGCK